MQKQLQAYVMCVCESCCSEHVSIMLMVSILACASPNEPWQQLQACFRNVTSNPPLLKLTFHAVLVHAWMLPHQIPGGFLPTTLAVASQFTTLVEHPTAVTVPSMLPSGLPPNSCYHPAYHQFYHPAYHQFYHPTVVTTHVTI